MEGDRQGGDSHGAAVGVSAEKNVDAVVVDGDLTEDEKIEKFYALIRNCKEVRERRRIEPERAFMAEDDNEKRRKRKRSTEIADRTLSSWIPAFKWEDFTEYYSQIQLRSSPAIFPSSFIDMQGGDRVRCRNDRPPPETDGGGLDLSLRL